MIKAIAFDFDGVLLESVDVKTRAFQRLFQNESPSHLKQIVDYHVRNGGISRFEKFRVIYQDILQRPLASSDFQRLCDQFALYVVEEVIACPWVPGAQEFLDRNAGKYTFFVVSATPDTEIKTIVARRGIEHYFKEVKGSPAEKAVLLQGLLQSYALAPFELVYVGDAGNDWQAARQLGIPFVWRRTHDTLPQLPGFSGPAIPSLHHLDDTLAHSPS